MSATMTNTGANDFSYDAVPPAFIRIAIPSFKIGWGKSKTQNPEFKGITRAEFQRLFNEDLNPSVNTKMVLTPKELRDYDRLLALRAALCGTAH